MLCRIVFCLADLTFSVYFGLKLIKYCVLLKLSCIHRLLDITLSAMLRLDNAPIVLVLVFECVLLLIQSVVIVVYHFNRGSVHFILM